MTIERLPTRAPEMAHPIDTATGLILPLSKSLGSQDLAKHRAMVAVELEVMAKKFDRFGWERDRGSMAHDRLISDWMDALHDYPLSEVQAACARWVRDNPNRMPNEGHIVQNIQFARRAAVRDREATAPVSPRPRRMSAQRANEILQEVGFEPKRFGKLPKPPKEAGEQP